MDSADTKVKTNLQRHLMNCRPINGLDTDLPFPRFLSGLDSAYRKDAVYSQGDWRVVTSSSLTMAKSVSPRCTLSWHSVHKVFNSNWMNGKKKSGNVWRRPCWGAGTRLMLELLLRGQALSRRGNARVPKVFRRHIVLLQEGKVGILRGLLAWCLNPCPKAR